ncbi:hypothetical protein DFH06DRAFT_992017 [Mycena polygramma]|nr:hypothetical protein DFH06DRAFT_992017 [Mycena polygramma]
MAPRFDFSPFRDNYFFLATSIVAGMAWLLAFIFQAITTAEFGRQVVGSLWFAIFHQGALNVGVIMAIITGAVPKVRFQIAAFGAIATMFAVQGADLGIFSAQAALQPMGAGYLVLAIVDILWMIYFTSEPDSLALNILSRAGAAPPVPPQREKSARRASAGTAASKPNYKLGGGVGSPEMGFHEPKRTSVARSVVSSLKRNGSAMSLMRNGTARSSASRKSLVGSITSDSESDVARQARRARLSNLDGDGGVASPGGGCRDPATSAAHSSEPEPEVTIRARALHAYKGSPEDPNELTFTKGEVLEIEDQEGKWWLAKKSDGSFGIAPSNYLVIIQE